MIAHLDAVFRLAHLLNLDRHKLRGQAAARHDLKSHIDPFLQPLVHGLDRHSLYALELHDHTPHSSDVRKETQHQREGVLVKLRARGMIGSGAWEVPPDRSEEAVLKPVPNRFCQQAAALLAIVGRVEAGPVVSAGHALRPSAIAFLQRLLNDHLRHRLWAEFEPRSSPPPSSAPTMAASSSGSTGTGAC